MNEQLTVFIAFRPLVIHSSRFRIVVGGCAFKYACCMPTCMYKCVSEWGRIER
jgi:hypothetical protein